MTNEEAIEIIRDLPIVRYEALKNQKSDLGTALRMACDALEKQIPNKIKCYEDKFIHCPNCEEALGYKWEKYPEQKTDFKWLNHCWNCGQRLEWGE